MNIKCTVRKEIPSSDIILYIIKVRLRRCGCAKWLHQIVEIFRNFLKFLDFKKKYIKDRHNSRIR